MSVGIVFLLHSRDAFENNCITFEVLPEILHGAFCKRGDCLTTETDDLSL